MLKIEVKKPDVDFVEEFLRKEDIPYNKIIFSPKTYVFNIDDKYSKDINDIKSIIEINFLKDNKRSSQMLNKRQRIAILRDKIRRKYIRNGYVGEEDPFDFDEESQEISAGRRGRTRFNRRPTRQTRNIHEKWDLDTEDPFDFDEESQEITAGRKGRRTRFSRVNPQKLNFEVEEDIAEEYDDDDEEFIEDFRSRFNSGKTRFSRRSRIRNSVLSENDDDDLLQNEETDEDYEVDDNDKEIQDLRKRLRNSRKRRSQTPIKFSKDYSSEEIGEDYEVDCNDKEIQDLRKRLRNSRKRRYQTAIKFSKDYSSEEDNNSDDENDKKEGTTDSISIYAKEYKKFMNGVVNDIIFNK